MLGRNLWTGEKIENSIEKAISLQIPEILKQQYDKNTIF